MTRAWWVIPVVVAGVAGCSEHSVFFLPGKAKHHDAGVVDGGDFGNPSGAGSKDFGPRDNVGNSGTSQCAPKTCEDLSATCGPVANGCGDVVQCGDCKDGELCGIIAPNVCTSTASLCKPLSKADACQGKECGIAGDGCGGTVTCGKCSNGFACGLEHSFVCGAVAVSDPNDCRAKIASCAAVGAQCGKIGNGCGGLIDCDAELGGCPTGTLCGVEQPQQCGALQACTPLTAAQACPGKCGMVSDGCTPSGTDTGLIDCTTDPNYRCPSGTSCGGGGVANQCGSATTGSCTPTSMSAACGSATCGVASDGCASNYVCGTCGSGQLCQNGNCVSACTPISKTTACDSKTCGLVGDGCAGSYDCGDCGTNEVCGQQMAFQCGAKPPAACVPVTGAAACAGKQCGSVLDGCGTDASHQIDCSSITGGCPQGYYCGVKAAYQCDLPPSPSCTPAGSCANLGWACGLAIDRCGNIYDCAAEGRTCNAQTQSCIGGINGPTTCQTGTTSSGSTCDVCSAIPDCTGRTQVTKLQGRVITPGKTDSDTANQVGVPNAFVYILASDDPSQLPALASGIPQDNQGNWLSACDRCNDQNLGPVLASATTDAQGNFTLSGYIPVNKEFVLVVKVGKWRRAQRYTLGANAACVTTMLPTSATRLPRTQSDGLAANIPRVAVSTGMVDAMECVLYKMGVAQSEFAQPGTNGTAAARVHMYASHNQPGEVMADGSTSDTVLYGTDAQLYSYDMVVFDCEGQAFENNSDDPRVRQYVNRGGRMFASHWSYTWVHDNGTLDYAPATAYDTRLDVSANWASGTATSGTGYVSINRPRANPAKIGTFAAWLLNEGAVTQNGSNYTFTITDPRDLAASVNAGSEEWVYRNTDACGPCTAALQAACLASPACTWNGTSCAPAQRCGSSCRNACANNTSDAACTAATGCAWTTGTSVQQYSFNTPYAAPSSAICGRVAYSGFHVTPGGGNFNGVVFPAGCGTGDLTAQEKVLLYMLFDLASCVTTGGTPVPPACTPLDMGACSGRCGKLPNGCGGTLDCGGCATGLVCGSNNMCQSTGCTKTTCPAQGATCGTIADGCGGTLDCGTCQTGQVCGLFTPNQCALTCTPLSAQVACSGHCGYLSDGCGGALQCSDCASGQACINNTCATGHCTPLTSCPSGKECGVISDGCSGTLDCGACTAPDVCGGGGQANKCGHTTCMPLDCTALNANCGFIGDGCGGATNCGACKQGQQCGLAGPNQCGGCMPRDCQASGAECGQIGDGCGGAVDCGPCPAGTICGATQPNRCGNGGSCRPLTCSATNAQCGLVGDGCGGVVDCGPCPSPLVCGISAPNQCGQPPACSPQTCTGAGAECGAIGDGCGGLIDCGSCPPGQSCGVVQANRCYGVPVQ
jgi:hypothetical protein